MMYLILGTFALIILNQFVQSMRIRTLEKIISRDIAFEIVKKIKKENDDVF